MEVREQIRGATQSEIDDAVAEKKARILWCRRYNYMIVAEIAYEKADEVKEKTEEKLDEPKIYSVFKYYGNQLKYISRTGGTFREDQAVLYTKSAAMRKVDVLNRREGNSVWGYKKSK